MAAGLVRLIAAVPWQSVVERAPDIVEGASRLLGLLKARPASIVTADPVSGNGDVHTRISEMQDQIAGLEARLNDAGILIGNLAATNASLVERLNSITRLAIGGAIGATIALALAIVAWIY